MDGIINLCAKQWMHIRFLNLNGVYRMMQKIADMTGVPLEKEHPHSLRHLFALTYIDTYNNIGELADILGHSSLEITRIYLSSSREEDTNTIILSVSGQGCDKDCTARGM